MTKDLKKEFYKRVRDDESLLDFIQEHAFDGLWYWNLNQPGDIWMNNRFLQVLGYAPQEQIHWKQLMHPDDKAFLNPGSLMLSDKDSLQAKPIRFIHQKGHTIHMIFLQRAIRDGQGKIQQVVAGFQYTNQPQALHEKYQTLLNSISDSVYIIDSNWNYLMANGPAERHTGEPREKIIHSNLHELFPDIRKTEIYELLSGVMKSRKAGTKEITYQFPDNRILWYDLHVYPIDEGILVISKDITERKKAQQTLEDNKKWFELMLHNSTDIIVELTKEGEQKYISPVAEKLTGYKPHELKGPISKVIHPDDLERIQTHWKEVLAEPDLIHRDSYRHIHKTTGYVWMEASLKSYLDDPDIQSIICSVRDISERKEAEELLRKSEERYKLLSQSATEMLALENLDDIYNYITNTLSKQYPDSVCLFVTVNEPLYKTEVASIEGLNKTMLGKVMRLINYDIQGATFNLLPTHYKKYKTGKLSRFQGGLAKFTGGEMPSSLAHAIEKLLGIQRVYAIGINKDEKLYGVMHFFTRNNATLSNQAYIESFIKQAGIVIDRKLMEQKLKESEQHLTRANATKDKFFSIIAHDLRNPFNLLLGFSKMNLDSIRENNFEKAEEYGELILDSARQGYELLNNLLKWAHSQQGTLEFKPERQQLAERVNHIKSFLSGDVRRKNIQILEQIEAGLTFYADQNMFDTILRNLLSNAVKYTHKGGKIYIYATRQKQTLTLKVEDTGVGIDQEKLGKLFQVAENISSTGTEGETGTGLGLILCKEFVERHGGNIGAESQPGKGSTFWFTLPLKESE